jgi:hypothetical protein
MSDRNKYRDNDDARDFQQNRSGVKPDSKAEARGDAREAVGNTARDTDADETGRIGNDRQKGSPRIDQYDDDLERDSRSRSSDEISDS